VYHSKPGPVLSSSAAVVEVVSSFVVGSFVVGSFVVGSFVVGSFVVGSLVESLVVESFVVGLLVVEVLVPEASSVGSALLVASGLELALDSLVESPSAPGPEGPPPLPPLLSKPQPRPQASITAQHRNRMDGR
jgi:hypothetical protein